jgi:hypothetical protein
MSRRLSHSLSSILAGSSSLVGLDRLSPLTGVDLANIRLALSSSSANRNLETSPLVEPQGLIKRHAAVLLGLCNIHNLGPGLILTMRSQKMRTHPGEIRLAKKKIVICACVYRQVYHMGLLTIGLGDHLFL